MTPPVECPYCGLDLLELPKHDLFSCCVTSRKREKHQIKILERIWSLQDPRPKEGK